MRIGFEIGKPERVVAECSGDRGKTAVGHKAQRENGTIEGFEAEPCAGLFQCRHQTAILDRKCREPRLVARIIAGERGELGRRPGCSRALVNDRFLGCRGSRAAKRLADVILFRVAEQPVQDPQPDAVREAPVLLVGQDDDADMPGRRKTDHRAKPAGAAIVPDNASVRECR